MKISQTLIISLFLAINSSVFLQAGEQPGERERELRHELVQELEIFRQWNLHRLLRNEISERVIQRNEQEIQILRLRILQRRAHQIQELVQPAPASIDSDSDDDIEYQASPISSRSSNSSRATSSIDSDSDNDRNHRSQQR